MAGSDQCGITHYVTLWIFLEIEHTRILYFQLQMHVIHYFYFIMLFFQSCSYVFCFVRFRINSSKIRGIKTTIVWHHQNQTKFTDLKNIDYICWKISLSTILQMYLIFTSFKQIHFIFYYQEDTQIYIKYQLFTFNTQKCYYIVL